MLHEIQNINKYSRDSRIVIYYARNLLGCLQFRQSRGGLGKMAELPAKEAAAQRLAELFKTPDVFLIQSIIVHTYLTGFEQD